MELSIRICETEEQLQALAALAEQIWHEYFVNIISEEQINYMVEKFQSYAAMSKAIKEDNYRYFLLCDGAELLGYCGVKPEEERLFLSKLYLRADMRGKGLSSKLLSCAIEYARELGLGAVYLTCNKYNENSLAVYRHKGFKQIDSIVTDIGHGFVMDDYVMQLDI